MVDFLAAVLGAAVFGPSPIGAVIISQHADMELLGGSPAQFVQSGPGQALYRALIDLVGFLLLVFGSFQASVAWYGLRNGKRWALVTLIVNDVLFISGWLVVLMPYLARGIAIAPFELPPNLLVSALLLIPASLFSLVGLRQTGTEA